MKCLLDMDGVIVDFVNGACSAHSIGYPYNNAEFHGHWNFIEKLGYDENEFWKPLGQEFWANLEPMPEFKDLIDCLENRFGSENICILTSPCANHGCIPGKMQWIEKHLPKYRRRFLAGPRKEFCAHRNSILIDDSDANINSFTQHGGNAILVPRLWNSLYNISHHDIVRYVGGKI